jgi:hypothetical protein
MQLDRGGVVSQAMFYAEEVQEEYEDEEEKQVDD